MLNWFSFNPNIVKYEDSYARTLQGKMLGIKSALKEATSDQAHVAVLVAHFVDTFTQLQDMLDRHQINYEVATSELNREWFRQQRDTDGTVWLTLAEMLEPLPEEDESPATEPLKMGVIVAEKHPLVSKDEHVQKFCESIPCRVKWGYFLSFEDALVRELVDERALKILDMFGMGQNELINSKMVSHQLNQALKKLEVNYHSRLPADSAAQWLQQNLK